MTEKIPLGCKITFCLIGAVLGCGVALFAKAMIERHEFDLHEYAFHDGDVLITIEKPWSQTCIGGGIPGPVTWDVLNGTAIIKFENGEILLEIETNSSGRDESGWCVSHIVVWHDGVREIRRVE
jgi:hypothetical protein